MTTKKKKSPPLVDHTDEMIRGFSKGFDREMAAEHEEHAAAPRVHDVAAGEVMDEVNPADADRHLED
jgi:hypothetical protein